MSKNDKLFTSEEFQQELDKLEWVDLSTFKKENPNKIDWDKDPPYYLYRSTVRPTGYAGDDNFLFAAPFVRLGMEREFDKAIKDFPIKEGAIVKVFEGSRDNKFYPDESIHFVEAGMQKDTGVPATDISEFDESLHEDTNAINNKKTEDMFIINSDASPAKIAKIDVRSKLFAMMKRNEMKDDITRIDFSKETLLDQEQENKDFSIIFKVSQGLKTDCTKEEIEEALQRVRNRKANKKAKELGIERGGKFGGIEADRRAEIAAQKQK